MKMLWLPSNKTIAELTMRIEAARYQINRLGTELNSANDRLARIEVLIKRLKDTLEFLGSHQVRIVLMSEYKAICHELQILVNESKLLSDMIRQYQSGQQVLQKEIEGLTKEIQTESNKVLRFKKRE